METQGTAKKTIKDWRKQGLGWVPDYPDARDYLLDSEEVQKSSNPRTNSGNLRRNEVTKSIEDIAENLLQILESLEEVFLPRQERALKEIKTNLENQLFGEFVFVRVKVFDKSLRLGTNTSEVRQLKYYFQLLSSHPKFLKRFQLIKCFNDDYSEYWKWLSNDEFDNKTEEIVKKFQNLVKIREDGIVGLETYTALGNCLREPDSPLPTQNTTLVNLLPIPIWIQEDTFPMIFRTLKSWWIYFNKADQADNERNVETALEGLLDPEKPENSEKFFTILKQEFYIIEPVASVITGMISPFAIRENLELCLEKALNEFKKYDIDKPKNLYIKVAISQAIKRINTELSELESKPNKTDQEKLNITFYEFIRAIVQGYIKKSKSQKCLTDDELNKKLTEFPPKYLFEIITQKDNQNSTDQACLKDGDRGIVNTNGNRDIVNTSELAVLVNRNWLEKHPHEKNQKPYGLLPSFADLSFWCSPIRNQGDINSCTAFAGVALLEYFARRNKDESTYISPLFLYKVARNLMNSTGDVGASVRETMKAMVIFGVPPEKYWSYEANKFDEEPPAFCYSYAQSYKTLKYFRLDRPDLTKEILLFQVQAVLAAGFPCIFGFTVYSSIYKEENIDKGYIPYPSKGDQVAGGHTVLAVGYDNYKEIKHSDGKGKSMGALLIRNSWGTEWGQKGYGWLPYDYILNGLTADWWSLIKAEWFEAGNFGLGAYAPGKDDTERGQNG